MIRLGAWVFTLLLCFIIGGPSAPASRPIVADLSNHLVTINTGFSGTDVLVFGATNDKPGDIVMVMRGPKENHVVRQKENVAGIWVNKNEVSFEQIPAFYAVASSAPLIDVAPIDVRKRHQMGLDVLALPAKDSNGHLVSDGQAYKFRSALLRLKEKDGLYAKEIIPVSTLENRLFRAELHLPVKVPVGAYTVEVYFVHEGSVIGAEITPLFVSKSGFSAEVFDFATLHSAKYAFICILGAMLAGWSIALIFRR